MKSKSISTDKPASIDLDFAQPLSFSPEEKAWEVVVYGDVSPKEVPVDYHHRLGGWVGFEPTTSRLQGEVTETYNTLAG